jgi:hypothetical protein
MRSTIPAERRTQIVESYTLRAQAYSKEKEGEDIVWTQLREYRAQYKTLLNTIMNHRVRK